MTTEDREITCAATTTTASLLFPRPPRQQLATRPFRTGVVITTHGERGTVVRECLESVLRHTPTPRRVIVYNNESSDPVTCALPTDFPEIEYVFEHDQVAGAGLTGTWERGTRRLILPSSSSGGEEDRCDIVVLLNHDTKVDASWPDLLEATWEAERRWRESDGSDRELWSAFGPVSDNPDAGASSHQRLDRQKADPENIVVARAPIRVVRDHVASGVNGFCFAFPRSVLLESRRDDPERNFFDLAIPFGGNENEWLWRFHQKTGQPSCFVVQTCFVAHHKFSDWRELY